MSHQIRVSRIGFKTAMGEIIKIKDTAYYVGTTPSFAGLSSSFIAPWFIYDDIKNNNRLLLSTYPSGRIAVFDTQTSAFTQEIIIPEGTDIIDMKWDVINNKILCYSRGQNGVYPLSYPNLELGSLINIPSAGYGSGMEVDSIRNQWFFIDQNRNLLIIDGATKATIITLTDTVCSNIARLRIDPFNSNRLYLLKNNTTLGIVDLTNNSTSEAILANNAIDIYMNPDIARHEVYTSGDTLTFYDATSLALTRTTDPGVTPCDYLVILDPRVISGRYWTAGGWPFMVNNLVRS